MPEDGYRSRLCGPLHTNVRKGRFRYVYDNIADPMHGSYPHGTTYMRERGSRVDRMKLAETEGAYPPWLTGASRQSFREVPGRFPPVPDRSFPVMVGEGRP